MPQKSMILRLSRFPLENLGKVSRPERDPGIRWTVSSFPGAKFQRQSTLIIGEQPIESLDSVFSCLWPRCTGLNVICAIVRLSSVANEPFYRRFFCEYAGIFYSIVVYCFRDNWKGSVGWFQRNIIRSSFVYRSSGRLSLRLAVLQPESYYLSNQYTRKSGITSNLNNFKCGQIRADRIMLRNSVG